MVAVRVALDRELDKFAEKIDHLGFLKPNVHLDAAHCVAEDGFTEHEIREVFTQRIICATPNDPMTDGERVTLIEALVSIVVHYHKLVRGQTYGQIIHDGGPHHPPNF